MKKGRRAFAIFMAAVMVLALLPTAAFAHDETVDEEIEALEVLGAIASDETESDFAEEAGEELDDAAEDISDDTFGGFAGDELDEDEDAAPEAVENTEDIAPVEDIENEDAAVEMYAADYGSAEEAPLQSKYTVYRTNAFEEGKGTLLLEGTGDRGKAPALDEAVLTDGGRYVIVGYNKVGNMEIPALPNNYIEGTFDIKVYVIDASSKASIVFKFVDEYEREIELPEGYAVRYTAEVSTDPDPMSGSKVSVSGKTTGKDPTYRVFTSYYNNVQFEFDEIDVPGYTYTVNIGKLSGEPQFGFRSGETSYWTSKIDSDWPDVDDTIITVGCTSEEQETYTVTWLDYDGNIFCTATVNKGKPVPEECPEGTPTHDSATFDGWKEPTEENGSFTVEANWIEPHLVTFVADGAATQQHEQTVKHGATAIEPEKKPEKAGYAFDFWTLDGETEFDFGTPITKNIELTAKWTPEKRTVTWVNGEEPVATDEVDYGTTVDAPEVELTNEGYRFDGWDFNFETEITEDTTISAKWVKQVTHTWINEGETVDSKTADEGAEVEAPANPTRSGYTFNGWTSSTDDWGNVTYTARWTANVPTGGGSTGGGSTIGGGSTGGNDEPIGGGEGEEGNDPADDTNDPNAGGENGEDENGGLVDIGDEGTALADRPFPFIDVNKNDWFYNDVYTVWEKEIMNGATATTFEPGTITTRSMLVTILYRLEGCPEVTEPSKFVDVAENEYYTDAIAWAAANGIVKGETEDTFSPNGIVLREQTAAILYRYAKYKGIDVSVEASEMAFEDADSITDYARDAMLWAVSTGLIKGVSEDRLAPQDGTERCQMATMLVRFMNLTETAEGEADEQ